MLTPFGLAENFLKIYVCKRNMVKKFVSFRQRHPQNSPEKQQSHLFRKTSTRSFASCSLTSLTLISQITKAYLNVQQEGTFCKVLANLYHFLCMDKCEQLAFVGWLQSDFDGTLWMRNRVWQWWVGVADENTVNKG